MEEAIETILYRHAAIYSVTYRGRGKEITAACTDPTCDFVGSAEEHIKHVASVIAEAFKDA